VRRASAVGGENASTTIFSSAAFEHALFRFFKEFFEDDACNSIVRSSFSGGIEVGRSANIAPRTRPKSPQAPRS
jgi:hypothetical protein